MAKPQNLKGFTRYERGIDSSEYLYTHAIGLEGCGKTYFGHTAPKPLAFINLNEGIVGVREEFVDDEIYYCSVHKEIGELTERLEAGFKSDAEKLVDKIWSMVHDAYMDALKSSFIKSICIDGSNELKYLRTAKRFGFPDKTPPAIAYGPINSQLERLFKLPLTAYPKHMVVLSLMGKEYKGGEKSGKISDSHWTGNYESKGFSKMKAICQVEVELYQDRNSQPVLEITKNRIKASGGMQLVGTQLTGFDDADDPDSVSWGNLYDLVMKEKP